MLRHDARAWVDEQQEEENFGRSPVTLGTTRDGDKGCFIAEGGGIKTHDLVVVTRAYSLLSEELKAQGRGEGDWR